MTPDPILVPGASVVDAEVIRRYGEWLSATRAASFDPYYSEEIARFELRDSDVLMTTGDARTASEGSCVLLTSESARARISVCGVGEAEASRVLAAIDGQRTAAEAREASGAPAKEWALLTERAFGVMVFAPIAVAALEQRVRFAEIVRFPGSPYETVRSYWENMAEARERLEDLGSALESVPAFVKLLRELHVVALVGRGGCSFYRPASPVASKEATVPGELLLTPSITRESRDGTRFLSGPRVSAALIGGERYHELLASSLGDAGALAPSRSIADEDGLPWGRVVTARAEEDDQAAPWFCPPRPLTVNHFEAIRGCLQQVLRAARSRQPSRAVQSLARLHWSFVRLHPFKTANQCLAMSLVNHLLWQLHGAGIPHLVLDHLALRLSRNAYERAFARALDGWLLRDPSPVRRTLELSSRKRRAFAILERLRQTRSLADAQAIVAEQEEDALLVLLEPAGAVG